MKNKNKNKTIFINKELHNVSERRFKMDAI